MSTRRGIGPFGFVSRDGLRAGWYLSWRLFVRLFPIVFVTGLIAGILVVFLRPLAMLLVVAGVVLYIVAWVKFTNQIARQWAATHGHDLTEGVFLEILWRTIVVWFATTIADAIVNVPVSMLLGGTAVAVVVGVVMFVATVIVTVLGQGWAMSHAVVKKLGGAVPAEAATAPPLTPPPTVGEAAASAMVSGLHAPPSPATSGARRQCPRCGLDETERGTVLGWYCRVCGWREGRR